MKTLLLIATLLTSTMATATSLMPTSDFQEFSVSKARFSRRHVANPGYASLIVNYIESKVTLTIEQQFDCPPNAMCILSMPAPLVIELPIVDIKADSCGINIVTALEDKRPVDGALQVLTVKDASINFCDMAFASTATYKTQFFNMMTGKGVTNTSKMELTPYMTTLE